MVKVIISQDYDGCYSIVAEGGVTAELEGPNKQAYENPKNAKYKTRLFDIPKAYNQYLDQITAQANSVSVYVGSDRQSFYLDKFNEDRNQNGSVFHALEALCQTRTTAGCPWTFEPYLLADEGHPRGEALRRMKSQCGEHLEVPESMLNEGSKIPMLLAQMKDAYCQYPGETLEFHFVDDRKDLIDYICENLESHLIPPGMTLKISKFDYIGIAFGEEGSLGLVKTILSSQTAQSVHLEEDTDRNTLESKSMMSYLTDCISKYLMHVKDKLKVLEIDCSSGALSIRGDFSPETADLVTRHNAILELEQLFTDKDSLDDSVITLSQNILRNCTKTRLDRDEYRNFLRPLVEGLKMPRQQPIDSFFKAEKHDENHDKDPLKKGMRERDASPSNRAGYR